MKQYTLFDSEIFEYFIRPGEVTEVRISGKPTIAGYFDDHEKFTRAVQGTEKQKKGSIYFTLQLIDHRLLGRACNRLAVLKQTKCKEAGCSH